MGGGGGGGGVAQAKLYADVAFSIPEIPIAHSCDRSQQLAVYAKVTDSAHTSYFSLERLDLGALNALISH